MRQVAVSAVRMILLLVCVSVLAFGLVSVSPIDPLQVNVGQAALGSMSSEQVDRLRAYWGADRPPVQRFTAWAADFIRGDMGTSLLYRRDVSAVIWEKLGNSLGLLIFAWVISGVGGFALGVLAGALRGTWVDRLIRGYCLLVASTPGFWLGLVLLMVFAVKLRLLPVGLSVPIGVAAADVSLVQRIAHGILPAVTLSITGIANIALHTRAKLIDVLESEYVLFAKARGEKAIVRRHGLRNILLPAVTLQFASVSEILGGSVIVEQVFSYPGLGQAAVTAGLGGDVPLLLGITVISAALVFFGNFTANLLYGVIDPRIKEGGR